MENEEEEDEIFTALQGGYERQEDVEEQEEEEEQEEPEAERKSSWDVPIPSRSLASRRASLPCPVSTQYKFLCVFSLYKFECYGTQSSKWEQKDTSRFGQSCGFVLQAVDEQLIQLTLLNSISKPH